MEYSAADMSYANPDAAGAGSIRVESSVRLKIIGSSVQATNMCAIGSINEVRACRVRACVLCCKA